MPSVGLHIGCPGGGCIPSEYMKLLKNEGNPDTAAAFRFKESLDSKIKMRSNIHVESA